MDTATLAHLRRWVESEYLPEYVDDVDGEMRAYLGTLGADELARALDRGWTCVASEAAIASMRSNAQSVRS